MLQRKTWNPAIIKEKSNTPRSFILQCSDGSTHRRNKKHILKTEEEQTRLLETDDYDISASQCDDGKKIDEQCQETAQNQNIEDDKIQDQVAVRSEEHRNNVERQIKTRSGRVIKN